MQPDLRVVTANRAAVGFDRVHGAVPERLEDLKDPCELIWVEVLRDRNSDDLLRVGAQQSRHPRVDVDDVHIRADPGDAERGMVDDFVEQVVTPPQLGFGVLALVQQIERVAVGQDLVGDEQDADARGEHGGEPVHVLVDQREPERRESGGEHRDPWQGELPELDRTFGPDLVDRACRPQRSQGDHQVADHPPGVEHAADSAVGAVGREIRE